MAHPHSMALNWAFTINNPEQELDHLSSVPEISYAVWQLEIGESGTPHYQGYLNLSIRARMQKVKKMLCCLDAHLEVCKGSPSQNRAYCTKRDTRIGDVYEIGIFPQTSQGTRTDLSAVHISLKNGINARDFCNEYFDLWVRYPTLVQNYQSAQSQERDESSSTTCILILGAPGTGKSTAARVLANRISIGFGQFGRFYRKQPGKWWNGYNGERCVLFDDFRGNCLSFSDFKLCIDRFPLRVEIKGAYTNLEAKTFVITSNFFPGDWWSEEVVGNTEEAILRRITEIYYFDTLGEYYHYSSYASFKYDYLTPRFENDPFVIPTPRQTFQLPEEVQQQIHK